ncbi:hypothetical protein BWI15_16275 [Kribbella sp. ALI-6-A]|uniref:hypothetical protein n=1 Tax=Kribbella sp. ALI-6-A TaxID=1933817 RepID=UPI00097C9D6E|nr:hypothetical protein [Kribbella sp. ALI-6-A]ONI71708.1 hypothetical protein BWI15_16275 [Kribbella sp. ALI-6-A]
MRVDLSGTQWDAMEQGRLTSPDGVLFQRRGTKAKRRICDEAISRGAPLVLFYWAGGQLDWLDGPDAQAVWQSVRAAVTVEPRARGELEWTAGLWQSEADQTVVVLTGHC